MDTSALPSAQADPSLGGSWVLPFEEVRAGSLPRVGGKGANLGELSSAGFPVPPGFCITTAAYARFLEAFGEASWIWEQLEGLDPGDLPRAQAVGARVRARLLTVPIPDELSAAILRAFAAAGAEHAYAVRSSATAEDLPDASFAGQQETYLNVQGEEALLEAVRACWVSLFTDRAILYRIQNGFSHRAVLLSVVVQRMILPEVSGILFTADPLSGHRHRLLIEASFGLGEALVSGLVTPDRYQLDKRSPEALTVLVADKARAVRPLAEGGTREEPLEESLRQARALSDAQIKELARLGMDIEAHYGAPQDIEWCLAGESFYILQSRPITSLYPLPAPAPDDAGLHVYLCFNHIQVMTDPLPPLAHSVWRYLFPFGKPSPRAPTPSLLEAGGRIYIDITPLLLRPLFGKRLPGFLSIADALISRILKEVVARPDFQAGAKDPERKARAATLLRWMVPILGQTLGWILFRRPESGLSRLEAHLAQILREADERLTEAPAGPERLRRAFEEVLGSRLGPRFRQLVPFVASGVLSFGALKRLLGERAAPGDLEALRRGLSGNVTTEMDHAVSDLADLARPYRALSEALPEAAKGAPLSRLRDIEGGPELLQALDDFLSRYGMRGPSEIDISRKRYRDDPRPLLQAVVGNLLGELRPVGEHRRRHEQLGQEGQEAAARLVMAARKGRLGFLRGPLVKRLTRAALCMMPLREHPKFLLINLMERVRQEIRAEAARLVQAGRLDAAEDVFLLDYQELLAGLLDPALDLRGPVARARAEMARFARMTPPRVMTSEGECPTASYQAQDVPPGALLGTAASGGVVEGLARVVLDPTREVLHRGEILVAPFTDPGWTPLFINAAGLVMEVGGIMTHGSVVAREYGIPAVVSVPEATRRIQTGQRVRVDGERGIVEILEDSP